MLTKSNVVDQPAYLQIVLRVCSNFRWLRSSTVFFSRSILTLYSIQHAAWCSLSQVGYTHLLPLTMRHVYTAWRTTQ